MPIYPFTLAPYACHPEQSRGRRYAEPESAMRTVFQRDRDRIIHSVAFRRLEYKTQVFINHEGDHYRTRLTHSLEVAQIARSISRALHLCEDLSEALALAHDVGHTPFGHAGEEGLDEAMAAFGGFDHNAQTIKVLTRLEHRYAEFDGLNLTWETLEGVAKHNGPLIGAMPHIIKEYSAVHDLALHSYPSAEAQVAALADDIAYNNHDIDDGLRAGLFSMEALEGLPVVGTVFETVRSQYKGIDAQRLIHEAIRRLINRMVCDLIDETGARIRHSGVETVEDVRGLGRAVVGFSDEMTEAQRQLKSFLMENMYRHYKVNRMTSKARRVVRDLFALFYAEPECLPTEWRRQVKGADERKKAEIIGDYIAGMTDRYALQEHKRLFDLGEHTHE